MAIKNIFNKKKPTNDNIKPNILKDKLDSFLLKSKKSPVLKATIGENLSPIQQNIAQEIAKRPDILSSKKTLSTIFPRQAERITSFQESIKTGSFLPLKQSFNKQLSDMDRIYSDSIKIATDKNATNEAKKIAFTELSNPVLGSTGNINKYIPSKIISEKSILRWAKEINPFKIAKEFKKAKVPQDIIDELTGPLSKAKTPEEVKSILINFRTLSKNTADNVPADDLFSIKNVPVEEVPFTQPVSQTQQAGIQIFKPLENLESDISLDIAKRAYDGTSFYPEKRAASDISSYVEKLTDDYNELNKFAKTPEQKELLDQEFIRYRDGYKKRMLSVLSSKAGTISPMISGRGNFPVARNNKRLGFVQNKYEDLIKFEEKVLKAIKRKLVPSTILKGTEQSTIDAMSNNLKELQDLQTKMKAANKIIKKGENIDEELLKLGYDQKTIDIIKKPDYAGRKGYPSFEVTSVNNRIKTLESKIAETSKKREIADTTGNIENKVGDVNIVRNFDENRIQLIFDNRPSPELITKLKSKGFKWSPKNSAWQRILTDNAIRDTKNIIKETYPTEATIKPQSSQNETISKPDTITNPEKTTPIKDTNIDLESEAKKYKSAEEFMNTQISYDKLPDEAKGALQSQMRVDVTNNGTPVKEAIAELNSKKFVETNISLSDIQKNNPDIFTDTFTKRGSMTKGSIVIDSKGEVIDGNNRVREAFDRGDKNISAYIEKPKSQLTDIWNKANNKLDKKINPESNVNKEILKDAKAREKIESRVDKINQESNRLTNEANTKKIVDETLNGEREDFRLSNPDILKQTKDYGVLDTEVKPNTKIIAYRASKKPINIGDSVTFSKQNAENYLTQREDSSLFVITAPASDFVRANGKKDEFIYAPEKKENSVNIPGTGRLPITTNIKDDIKYVAEAFDNYQDGIGEVFLDEVPVKATPEEIIKISNNISDTITKTEKELSEIDQLIADGKIRVITKDNSDVYQIKHKKRNGDTEWVNVKDESSAIKKVTTPKPEAKPIQLSEHLNNMATYIELQTQLLNDHPAKFLEKYFDKKEGRLPEGGITKYKKNGEILKTSKWKMEGDKIANDAGFDSVEEARESFDSYYEEKLALRDLKKKFSEQKKNELIKNKIKTDNEILNQKVLPKSSPIDITTGEGRSLEILSDQALEILDSEAYVGSYESLADIIEKTVTNVKNKVHLIDTYLTTPKYVMKKIGFEKEYDLLRNGMYEYWKELPKNIDKITQWSKGFSQKQNEAIFDYLDGKAADLPPNLKKVALEIREWLKEWAKRLDLPKEDRISYYITHIFEDSLIQKEFDEDLAKIITDKVPGAVYDPFLLERLGVKGYKRDTWAALNAYVKRATRKVHIDPALEVIQDKAGRELGPDSIEKSQWKYIQRYIDNINMRPTEKEEGIDNLIKSILGYKLGQRPTTNILSTFRKLTYRGLLGLNPASALRNLSQGANTYAELGEKYTALGYLKLFNKGANQELIREGVLSAGFIQDKALSVTQKFWEKTDKVLFGLFDIVEKINRGAAYHGAKAKALSNGKSEKEAIKFAKEIVQKTQFLFDSVDTPVGMGSTLMKTLSQFQSYTTKQVEYLGGKVKGSVKGQNKAQNMFGLLRYAFAGLVFTYTIGRAFGMKPKELIPWFRFKFPVSLNLPAEILKAGVNAPDKYGNTRDLKTKANDILKAGIPLIPGGSQARKTIQGIQSVTDGGVFSKNGRLQFKQGDSTAKKVQAIMFGKYASKEAQDYFNKDKIKEKEQKPVRKVYDQAQDLLKENKETEADILINNLSDEDFEVYKEIRKKERTLNSTKFNGKLNSNPEDAVKFLREQNLRERARLLDNMSDEEYLLYESGKKELDSNQ